MSFFGKPLAVAVGAVALSGTAMVPLAHALTADAAFADQLPQVADSIVTPAALPATPRPAEALLVEQPGAPEVDETDETPAPAPARAETQLVDAELTCLAKVVLHESGNQPRHGQLAVAQVVMNRVNDPRGRFGRTICGVVMQRGQFFNVHAYNPRRDARWWRAVEVAREARDGGSEQVVGGGALFFHSASAGIAWRGRTRLARVGGHIFYR